MAVATLSFFILQAKLDYSIFKTAMSSHPIAESQDEELECKLDRPLSPGPTVSWCLLNNVCATAEGGEH